MGSQQQFADQRAQLEVLHTDEQQLRQFVKNSAGEIIMLDSDLRYLVVSPKWLEGCDLSEQEIIGRHHHEMSPNIPEHWKSVHRRCLSGAIERCEEEAYLQANGSLRWVRWETRPWYDGTSQIAGIVIAREGIAEHKLTHGSPSDFAIAETQGLNQQAGHRVGGEQVSPKPFNLLRSFALLSLLSIGLITAVSATLLLSYLSNHMLQRDAVVTMEFVQSIRNSLPRAMGPFIDEASLGEPFAYIASMPDVVRANVYAPNHMVVWSDDKKLIGRHFPNNSELKRALAGELVFELVSLSKERKAEHSYFSDDVVDFVENYIPIWNDGGSKVIAVVEVYKVPHALLQAIQKGKWLVWVGALVGGLFLYATLFWIVRRASIVMQRQQERLVTSETMATIGEMASAVAHSIRNPLASIRSRAELAAEDPAGMGHEAAQDITEEVDHLEQWVRELLIFSRPERTQLEPVQIAQILRDSLNGFSRAMENQGIELVLDSQETVPPIRGDTVLLNQMFNSLISNALEAMATGGVLSVTVRTTVNANHIELAIADTGQGVPWNQLDEIFKPFVTSRPGGLGLGLPLAKRIVERHEGTILMSNNEGRGSTVSLRFPRGA